jgi:hypothetical protein
MASVRSSGEVDGCRSRRAKKALISDWVMSISIVVEFLYRYLEFYCQSERSHQEEVDVDVDVGVRIGSQTQAAHLC